MGQRQAVDGQEERNKGKEWMGTEIQCNIKHL